MGFNVTRERIRQAVRENDPIHTALRWRGELVRRQPYSVPGPNSLWHIGMLLCCLFEIYSSFHLQYTENPIRYGALTYKPNPLVRILKKKLQISIPP